VLIFMPGLLGFQGFLLETGIGVQALPTWM